MRSGFGWFLLPLVLLSIPCLPAPGASRVKIQAESEQILAYLTQHHPDFSRMTVVPHSEQAEGQWQCLLVLDGSQVLDRLVLPTDTKQRSLFKALSGPVLRPRNPTVNPDLLSWLEIAWYWDFRVLETPALIDLLADTLRGVESENITLEEARAFWYYRLQLSASRNRRALHQSWIHDPEHLQRLSPEFPWTEEDTLQVFTSIDLRLSPILSPYESLDLLHALQVVPFCWEGNPSRTLTTPDQMQPPHSLFVRNRIDFIRQWILHINPVAMNALRSLGIAYEYALDENHQKAEEAWMSYIEDLRLVEEVLLFLSAQAHDANGIPEENHRNP